MRGMRTSYSSPLRTPQLICIASLRTIITMSNNANQSTDSKKQVADSDGTFRVLKFSMAMAY